MQKTYLISQEFEEKVNDIGVKITNVDNTAGYMYVSSENRINYSYDGITWRNDYTVIFDENSDWGYGQWCIPDPIQSGQSVYLKAASAYSANFGYDSAYFDCQFKFNIEGDLVYLYEPNGVWDYTKTYKRNFVCGHKVVDASKLILSLLNLNNLQEGEQSYGYPYAFRNCIYLTKPPKLKATVLTPSCYERMFYNCTSLISAPQLPATTLAERCYYEMFSGCTSLQSAPAIPATTVAKDCCNQMFYGCTGLFTPPPILLATTLANRCYQQMFAWCSNLLSTPQLPATTLAKQCYENMFWQCTNLCIVPKLPATTLTDRCYQQMFAWCSNLFISTVETSEFTVPWRIPESGTGVAESNSLNYMFNVTEYLKPNQAPKTPTINTTYYVKYNLV